MRGVSHKEAEELKELAARLNLLGSFRRSDELKEQFLAKFSDRQERKAFFWPRVLAPALALVLLLFILGGGSVVLAQKSLPGNFLYPVKRLSEKVNASFNPEFRQEIIVIRSEEVKDLVEKKEDPALVKSVLEDFSKESKKADKNKGDKLEESLRNLKEAREKSTEPTRREIERTIKELENKDKDHGGEVKGRKFGGWRKRD